jgi:hypothetical protein
LVRRRDCRGEHSRRDISYADGPCGRTARRVQEPAEGPPLDIRKPPLDAQGRFWVYSNSPNVRFVPYAFMPPELANKEHMTLDLLCTVKPHVEAKPAAGAGANKSAEEKQTCVSFTVNWTSPDWCAVAWIAGPPSPPFWGEDARGTYYDLSALPKKRLVFYARSDKPTRIKAKVGILSGKKYGDSLAFPAETGWLLLSDTWKKFEVPLGHLDAKQLQRVTNGWTFEIARAQQDDDPKSTTVYFDTVYYE